MNRMFAAKELSTRLANAGDNMDELKKVFADYKTVLNEAIASGEAYYKGLRRFQEEFPDLERIITRGHVPVLKGRISDGINALKKKIEELETPPDPIKEAAQSTPSAENADSTPEQPRPFRNMPTLGMD